MKKLILGFGCIATIVSFTACTTDTENYLTPSNQKLNEQLINTRDIKVDSISVNNAEQSPIGDDGKTPIKP